ncbi:MAG: hypothetical protein SAK29_24850, partial [Scytonema sp. PMC 1069.18]|nr:hypothetical protein [Scytonema sp. PMC 1069.18]
LGKPNSGKKRNDVKRSLESSTSLLLTITMRLAKKFIWQSNPSSLTPPDSNQKLRTQGTKSLYLKRT